MSVRKSLIILALAATGATLAQAQNTSTWVGGELGFVDGPAQSTLSREQVRQDLQTFRAAPVAADGARYVGGEIGYVAEQHAYARVNGQWVCIDNIAHNAKLDAIKSDAEKQLFRQLYPA
jgi:hypothetical protein